MIRFIIFLSLVAGPFSSLLAQQVIKGSVRDLDASIPLIGATIVISGTTEGVTSDLDGDFRLETDRTFPLDIVISFMGYQAQTITVKSEAQRLKIDLTASATSLDAFEVVDYRVSEKQRQEPLTVERMDVIAIKETPSDNFYDGLALLKGVDITAASLGFKVINTRGFNSTSPVRSLQLIDGMDNQSPGLNFSLGNFLGSSDLDVMSVDIVAGASSPVLTDTANPGKLNGSLVVILITPLNAPGP